MKIKIFTISGNITLPIKNKELEERVNKWLEEVNPKVINLVQSECMSESIGTKSITFLYE